MRSRVGPVILAVGQARHARHSPTLPSRTGSNYGQILRAMFFDIAAHRTPQTAASISCLSFLPLACTLCGPWVHPAALIPSDTVVATNGTIAECETHAHSATTPQPVSDYRIVVDQDFQLCCFAALGQKAAVHSVPKNPCMHTGTERTRKRKAL